MDTFWREHLVDGLWRFTSVKEEMPDDDMAVTAWMDKGAYCASICTKKNRWDWVINRTAKMEDGQYYDKVCVDAWSLVRRAYRPYITMLIDMMGERMLREDFWYARVVQRRLDEVGEKGMAVMDISRYRLYPYDILLAGKPVLENLDVLI